MTLPKAVVVGHRRIKIKELSVKRSVAEHVDGLCDLDNSTIWVLLKGQTGPQTASTLRHEINHTIWTEAGLGRTASDERVATVFGNYWTQIERDSPDVTDWIAEKARS